jgi:hypothetical protein
MSEGEGGNFGLWRPERREDEPFKDVRRGGGGYFRFPPWEGYGSFLEWPISQEGQNAHSGNKWGNSHISDITKVSNFWLVLKVYFVKKIKKFCVKCSQNAHLTSNLKTHALHLEKCAQNIFRAHSKVSSLVADISTAQYKLSTLVTDNASSWQKIHVIHQADGKNIPFSKWVKHTYFTAKLWNFRWISDFQ